MPLADAKAGISVIAFAAMVVLSVASIRTSLGPLTICLWVAFAFSVH